jgi:hypothetical protein
MVSATNLPAAHAVMTESPSVSLTKSQEGTRLRELYEQRLAAGTKEIRQRQADVLAAKRRVDNASKAVEDWERLEGKATDVGSADKGGVRHPMTKSERTQQLKELRAALSHPRVGPERLVDLCKRTD